MVYRLKVMAAVMLLLNAVLYNVLGVSAELRGTQQSYYSLMDKLFLSYKPEVRPNDDGHETLVHVAVSLLSIQTLDEKSQMLESSLLIDAEWNDKYLTWNESEFGEISSFLYHQKKVWLPDIIVENSIESQTKVGYDENFVRIGSSGYIHWRSSQVARTGCDIDVTYYPFDTQTCVIMISTWMSTKSEIGKRTERMTRKLRAWLGINKVTDQDRGEPQDEEPVDVEPSAKNSFPARSKTSVTPLTDKPATISCHACDHDQEEITWPKVAETVDRVMFFLTSGLIALITLVFFAILMHVDLEVSLNITWALTPTASFRRTSCGLRSRRFKTRRK
ncbi:acetylcholine receptor subunit alpha-like protein 1 [Elysia marginata]|uniref:Acetylcholine receptor subunit alpha-like protein 1 n=1 Tax=Elysia marginata TaxID=1093978 RepID=A0AAV4JS16_9GAST|nr:acetylcholine receptor subunit alpha-like protein 1 [Elysia marginata]